MIKLNIIDRLKFLLIPGILRRLLRIRIFNYIKYKNIEVLILKKKIIFYKNLKFVKKINIDRGSRPLKSGIAIINDKMYYGDYWSNPKKNSVNLYEVDLINFNKKIFFTFNNIRHIHCIKEDIFKKNYLIITTGDQDSESGIYRLNLNTKKILTLGYGSQKFRTVSILQKNDKIIYGSDDHEGENYIYVIDEKTRFIKSVKKIDGPAYYSAEDKKGYLYIATTIENRKRHKAIIYFSKDCGDSWYKFKKFKKDIWNSKYFGYGIVEFPYNQHEFNELKYDLFGLEEIN